MKNLTIKLLIGLTIALFGCESQPKRVIPAFYHWQTNLSITESEHSSLQKIGAEKIYVKFFDIDWSENVGEAMPQAILNAKSDYLKNYEIIPTVFITNRTFSKLSKSLTEKLANQVAKKLESICAKNGFEDVQEIQFDCDWSESTREKFFFFLEKFKKYFSKKTELSATIRLHQIKFFEKTGVPPVDKGMLMFYNMNDVTDWKVKNSILDLAEAEKYLGKFDIYPLTLDLVLPAYSWGVLFREGEMIKLMPGVYSSDCEQFVKVDSNRYKIKSSTYFQSHYLYENDRIRLENVKPQELLKAAQMLSSLMKNPTLTVGFYHLHEHSFKRYSHENYLEILGSFEK